jgi:hypothetical protein
MRERGRRQEAQTAMSNWFRRQELEIGAIAYLVCGIEPYCAASNEEAAATLEPLRLLKQAIRDKQLAGIGRNSEGEPFKNTRVARDDLLRWADANGYSDFISLCARWAQAQLNKPWKKPRTQGKRGRVPQKGDAAAAKMLDDINKGEITWEDLSGENRRYARKTIAARYELSRSGFDSVVKKLYAEHHRQA